MNGQSAAKAYKPQKMIKPGSIYNKVEVIGFAIAKKSRSYYNTRCLVCDRMSIRRNDHIKTNPNYCKHCKDSLSRTINTESVINTIYGGCKSNAKTRNLVFDLSKENFLKIVSQNCFYCNQEPIESQFSKSANRSNIKFLHNGVDRLNSKVGYVIENCVPCCSMCNLMKNKFSVEDFINKVKQIYVYKQCSTTMPEGSTLQANGSGNGRGPEMDHDIV
jgi:hypothetical protein